MATWNGLNGNILKKRHGGVWSPFSPITPHLPFNMPARTSLVASTPGTQSLAAEAPVFAHYFIPFPQRLNAPNEIAYDQYNNPTGIPSEADKYKRAGGYLRDRPKLYTGAPTTGDWELADMKDDVRQAIAMGIDGFTVDLLVLSDFPVPSLLPLWQRVVRLYDAADAVRLEDGVDFWIIPMPDGTSTACSNKFDNNIQTIFFTDSVNSLADHLAIFKNRPSQYKRTEGGVTKMVVAPFAPETWVPWVLPGAQPANSWKLDSTGTKATEADRVTFWQDLKVRMQGNGPGQPNQQILLWNIFVNSWTTRDAGLYTVADGLGRWGDRDAVTVQDATGTDNARAAKISHTTYSKPWVHWTSPGDHRPNEGIWGEETGNPAWYATTYRVWENRNLEAYRGTWLAAMNGDGTGAGAISDAIQVNTWNDYSEHAHVNRTVANDWSLIDIGAYYATWFKTKTQPTIVRDVIYLSHRIHRTDIPKSSIGTYGTQEAWGTAATIPLTNHVEAMVFLSATANVEIRLNGSVITSETGLTAGMHVVRAVDGLQPGTWSVHVMRGGSSVHSVTSPHAVTATPPREDFMYRTVSSRR